jgi:2'-5' RNA ligase
MKVRSFLAIELPDTVRNAFQELHSRIVLPQFDVRWVKPENIHLTFRFFGEVPVEDIRRLSEAVRKASQHTAPCLIRIRGLGAFPNMQNPRVVWTGIEDPAPLFQLERRISKELDRIGWPPPDKPFQPHLTLGRVRSSRGRRELQECLERNEHHPVGDCYVDHISLVKSDLYPSGPVYTILDRFFFSLSLETQS